MKHKITLMTGEEIEYEIIKPDKEDNNDEKENEGCGKLFEQEDDVGMTMCGKTILCPECLQKVEGGKNKMEEKCEKVEGIVLTSNPPKYRCKKCHNSWFCQEEAPVCKGKVNKDISEERRLQDNESTYI